MHESKSGKSGVWQYLLIVYLFILSACAPLLGPTKEKQPLTPETLQALKHFEDAQRLFEKQSYPEALAIYQSYLKQFPKGPLVDTALMKIGLVYMAVENYAQARKAFQRLLRHYRTSPFAEDARFNVILTYYKEGDYRSALQHAKSVLQVAKTRHQRFRIHNLMGYICIANRQFKDAISSYMKAYEIAPQQERPEVMSKVKEVITYLKEPDLKLLIGVYGDRFPGGYLRLQLAREYASEDRIDPAMEVFSDLISLFPDHDEIEKAKALKEELESRSFVDLSLIGCILPLSGPYATFGNRALTGIELALDQFNAQPYVNPIRLLIKDSKGDPTEAVAALETLVLQDGVVGVIGPMITSESAAIKAQDLGVPIMTLTQKPNIAQVGDYVFRNFLTMSLQVKAIVEYAVEDLGLERLAILYPDEPYGISFMNRFWDELIGRGAEVVAVESYGPEQTDFSDAIAKLVGLYYPRPEEPPAEETPDAGGTWDMFLRPQEDEDGLPGFEQPYGLSSETASDQEGLAQHEEEEPKPIIDFEAIFIPDSFEKVGLITPQFLYHDVANVLLLGTNLWHSDKLIEMAGGYIQGAVVPDGFFANSPSFRVRSFVMRYEDVFGRPPAFLEAQAYDAASIFFRAANDPQVRSRRTLKMAIMEVEGFPGVTGDTSFDETGDVEKDIYLLTVKGRRFVQIRP